MKKLTEAQKDAIKLLGKNQMDFETVMLDAIERRLKVIMQLHEKDRG
jgi:hypothetical protein